ncbi:MAG: hypothetical protein ACREIW_03525 [Chthoniobacterales bacterium]
MQKNYRIRISRAGEDFEAEGDKRFVLDMLQLFEHGGAKRSKGQHGGHADRETSTAEEPPGKTLSAGEFIRRLGSKKHVDMVLAFAYYLEKYADTKAFTPADINNCYYDAKMEASNTSQMIILNIRRGHLMEAKQDKGAGKKRYTITNSGEEQVERQLANAGGNE